MAIIISTTAIITNSYAYNSYCSLIAIVAIAISNSCHE